MNRLFSNILICFMLLLGVAQGRAASEGMTVSKMNYDASIDKWVVHIGLESTERTYRAFQCDLAFPVGVTLSNPIRFNSERVPLEEDPSTGDLVRTHKLYSNILKNGTLRMVVISMTNREFLGVTGDILVVSFADNGVLDKSKSYDVNLTNIELVYKMPGDVNNKGFRQQGLINDVSLRCHDAMCNSAGIYGEISKEDLEWLNNFLLHNSTLTSVDVTHCTNAYLGTLFVKNPNTVIYTRNAAQMGSNRNVVVNGVCKKLILSDKLPFNPIKEFNASASEFVLTMTDARYATVVLPFSCDIPVGLKAYRLVSVDDMDNSVKGESVHAIVAHQPVLLKGEPGEYVFSGTSQAVTLPTQNMSNGLLTGTYLAKQAAPGCYLLQKHGEEVAFYRVAEKTQPGVKPFRAYLENYQGNLTSSWLSIHLGESTGLEGTELDDENSRRIYNVQGVRVFNPSKGVHIIKDKDRQARKVLIK